MTRPTVSHNLGPVRLAGVRRTVCHLCKKPMPSGGWGWAVTVPGRYITRDGGSYAIELDQLWCDECEKKKR